jgi:hypothetical protein
MNSFRFGTAINCIDGRTQQVVIDHLKQNYDIDGVDMATFPGADGFFSNRDHSEEIALIRRAVSISIEKHGSQIIAEVGHYDCAGNPGDREQHYMHIRGWRCVKCPHGIYLHKSLDFMSMTSERLRK